jgi:hypothetical protein
LHHLSPKLDDAVRKHSKRYEGMFRDRENEVNRAREMEFVMEDHPIIDESELPVSHPHLPADRQSKGRDKWDSAVQKLCAKNNDGKQNSLFSDVLFILQHDDWYTTEAFVYLRQLANQYQYFTPKQRANICAPPKLEREEDYDDFDY